MYKNSIVSARIDSVLKTRAEVVLHKVGLSPAEAVRLFYAQICLCQGLPFEVKIPNQTTIQAMKEADAGRTHQAKSVDDLFEGLE